MALRTRGGVGGGGSLVVNDHTGQPISTRITELEWQTLDQFGFTVTIDPENPSKGIVGTAPVFLDPITWSSEQTTTVRVSESDPLEPDTYLTNSRENTSLPATQNNFIYNSTLGRGFGDNASLSVKTYHAGVLVDDVVFVCNAAGNFTQGSVNLNISNYNADGDGSAFTGKMRVTVVGDSVIGSTNSGQVKVELSFTEHKWNGIINLNEDAFRDKNLNPPSIGGDPLIGEDLLLDKVTKFLSGIQYYTLNSPFSITTPSINNHNEDTSRPTDSLVIDSSEFGITSYNTSPWTNGSKWENVGNLDTAQDFIYEETKNIDVPDFRHIGNSKVINTIRDSWSNAVPKNSNTMKVCIDTFNNPSTNLVEYFDSENKRLESDYTTAWDSERYCVDGEAVVFGGSLYHGSDLPTITKNTVGGLTSLSSLNSFLPNELVDGTPRSNPNYTIFTEEYATHHREFIPSNLTSTYSSFTMNVLANQNVETMLKNGDLKIFLWKEGSVNAGSPNVGYPLTFDPANQTLSETGSIWLHGNSNYNFGTFTDGAVQVQVIGLQEVNTKIFLGIIVGQLQQTGCLLEP